MIKIKLDLPFIKPNQLGLVQNRKHLQTDNFLLAHIMEFVLEWTENIVRKGKKYGSLGFSHFPIMF